MTTVWILSTGEDCEGGSVSGVYTEKELAFGDFLAAARLLYHNVTAWGTSGGGVYAHGGCDWVELAPHTVVERHAIAGDPIADVAALIGAGQ